MWTASAVGGEGAYWEEHERLHVPRIGRNAGLLVLAILLVAGLGDLSLLPKERLPDALVIRAAAFAYTAVHTAVAAFAPGLYRRSYRAGLVVFMVGVGLMCGALGTWAGGAAGVYLLGVVQAQMGYATFIPLRRGDMLVGTLLSALGFLSAPALLGEPVRAAAVAESGPVLLIFGALALYAHAQLLSARVAEQSRRGELAERNAELTALGASLERKVEERTRSLADAVQRLERSEAELREVARAVTGAREAESARISRELHDELGQLLTGLKISTTVHARRLRRGGDATGAAEAERLTSIVDDSLQSVRRVSRELRPAMLDDIGLGAALEWLVSGYTERTGIAARVELLDEAADLGPEQRTALFRVSQEALTNAARHAAASAVCVRLERSGGALTLTIEDDGVGMPGAGGAPGLGLSGMRERARAIGADLDISAGRASGARVTLTLPVPTAA